MDKNKNLMVKKEGFFTKIINKIKNLFGKEIAEDYNINNRIKETKEEFNGEIENKKDEFLNNIKVESNSEIVSLKVKLESGEIRSIDLTLEQMDELKKIYDKEILEKKEKIKKLQSVA